MTKILRSLYLEKEQVERIIKLSKRTRVPQAVLVREGVDIMLKKREKELQRKKKKKGDNK
jgi:predicted DNA-binding protein